MLSAQAAGAHFDCEAIAVLRDFRGLVVMCPSCPIYPSVKLSVLALHDDIAFSMCRVERSRAK